MKLIDQSNQTVLLNNVTVAKTIWQRFRGLMLQKRFPLDFGLWITPCRSVHTMWMRVPIDVYFIDRSGVVTEHRSRVPPWSLVVPKQKSQSVLEIPNASIQIPVGTSLSLVGSEP